MMRILEINTVCGVKSTGRICTDLVNCLLDLGHECLVAYGREDVPEKFKPNSIKIASEYSVRLHALKSRFLDNVGFCSANETKKFIDKIKEYDPDIIHLHNIHGYYINIELLFKYLAESKKPVVWTLHDCWAFTGHCCYFDYVDCKKWREDGCFSCPQKGSYPQTVFLDRSDKNFKRKKELFTAVSNMTIVTPSKWLADRVKESFLSKYPIKVINNGIDVSCFKPTKGMFREKYGLNDKKIVLGVAAVWDERKGLKDIIKLSENIDDSIKIVLVGLSKKQIKELPENILGLDKTNSVSELAEIYTVADILINPTYEDNYPTVNLEAQACGTPVVTYNTGGSPESIDLKKGKIVPQGDISALIEAINEINGKLSPDIDLYDKNKKYREYIELYSSLL